MTHDPNVPSGKPDDTTIPLGVEPVADGDGDGDDYSDVEDLLGDICPNCGEEPTGRL